MELKRFFLSIFLFLFTFLFLGKKPTEAYTTINCEFYTQSFDNKYDYTLNKSFVAVEKNQIGYPMVVADESIVISQNDYKGFVNFNGSWKEVGFLFDNWLVVFSPDFVQYPNQPGTYPMVAYFQSKIGGTNYYCSGQLWVYEQESPLITDTTWIGYPNAVSPPEAYSPNIYTSPDIQSPSGRTIAGVKIKLKKFTQNSLYYDCQNWPYYQCGYYFIPNSPYQITTVDQFINVGLVFSGGGEKDFVNLKLVPDTRTDPLFCPNNPECWVSAAVASTDDIILYTRDCTVYDCIDGGTRPPPETIASFTGEVFCDLSGDGIKDAGEDVIPLEGTNNICSDDGSGNWSTSIKFLDTNDQEINPCDSDPNPCGDSNIDQGFIAGFVPTEGNYHFQLNLSTNCSSFLAPQEQNKNFSVADGGYIYYPAVPTTPGATSCDIPSPTATPTPTPTSTPSPTPTQGPWNKLSNASFQTSNDLDIPIPSVVVAYDQDDTIDPYFVINQGGLISAGSIKNLTVHNPGAQTSANNWQIETYSPRTALNKDKFLSYVKSRKEDYRLLTTLSSDLSEIQNDGIYYFDASAGTLTINNNPQYNFVLIVDGTVEISITGNEFNVNVGDTPFKSIAILADNIVFSSSLTKAYGLFIATNDAGTGSVETGINTDQGLKIKGNLITSSLTNGRKQQSVSNTKPSVFIVISPQTYLYLLPYLSVSQYKWQQLE